MLLDDNQNVLNLMIALQRCGDKPFPQHIVDTLGEYFSDNTVFFFPGPSYELLHVDKGQDPAVYEPKFYHPVNFNRLQYAGKLKEYTNYYYKHDAMQPVNMPDGLKNLTVLRFSDTKPSEEYKKSEMYRYLKSCDLPYNATVYLRKGDVCIAGIALLRREELGDYTDNELKLLELIGHFLTSLYLSHMQESFQANIAKIYRSYHDSVESGFAILSTKFEVVEANATIDRYCRRILENATDQELWANMAVPGGNPITNAARIITQNAMPATPEFEHMVRVGEVLYQCAIKPCMLMPSGNDIQTLYTFQISKRADESSLSESVARQFSLTNREKEIVDLIVMGRKTDQISQALYISNNTVKNHISNIFRKLEVSNRIELLNKLKGK